MGEAGGVDPQEPLVVAEAALSEGEIDRAEDAALEALSRIRQLQGDGS